MKRVALVAVFNEAGKLLLGKRRDNGRWTICAGHIEAGEDPHKGALREMYEESGLKPDKFTHLEERKFGSTTFYVYEARVKNAQPTNKHDPDDEVLFWRWVDVSDGVPKNIAENLAGPRDPNKNVVLELYGLKKSERRFGYEALLDFSVDVQELQKMAIADIQPGKETARRDLDSFTHTLHDYTHVLKPEHQRQGFKLEMHTSVPKGKTKPKLGRTELRLFHRDQDHNTVGRLYGSVYFPPPEAGDTTFHVGESFLQEPHRGQGFGQAMYEASYAHAKHHLAATVVRGEEHSTLASKVHALLSAKHGLNYYPLPNYPSSEYETKEAWQNADPEPYDARFAPYQYDLKSEMKMNKAEADEVDRMLLHPNPVERRLALKLRDVQSHHLVRALGHDDPELHHLALRHPAMDGSALLALMQMPDRKHLQLLGLTHPKSSRAHVEALYHTHKGGKFLDKKDVLHAISQHPSLDAGLIEQMVKDGNGHGVIENLHTPPHVLQKLVEEHFLDPTHDDKRRLARRALKHPSTPPHLVERALKEGSLDVQLAASHAPHLPEPVVHDILARGQLPAHDGEAYLRAALVQHPEASERHKAQASTDRNHLVRRAAQPALKKFNSYSKWLDEQLIKASRPADFAGIVRASHNDGRALVDHKPDLEAHPPEHNADVQAYKQAVLDSPEPFKRHSAPPILNDSPSGLTRKLIYELPATHPTHANVKFMVKPYHERPTTRLMKWSKNPHQGWAEMTNQALFHAGGIGNLHQAVHVSEHNMGKDLPAEPALVVRMTPGYNTVHSFGLPGRGDPESTKHDVRRIALMDFLAGNLDRHSANLLYKTNSDLKYDGNRWQSVPPPGEQVQSSVKAIDHSRNFQYQNTHDYRWTARSKQPKALDDSFMNYVQPASGYPSAVGRFADLVPPNGRGPGGSGDWQSAFDWWGEASPKVREAFDQRLGQIKDPEVQAHLRRNFNARAAWLDDRAKWGLRNFGDDWYKDSVPLYRPGELTDEERAQHDFGPLEIADAR